ncbi:MAG: glycosyltransferase family 2 protein [Cyanobacteria bacterium P01_G01_bin.39]
MKPVTLDSNYATTRMVVPGKDSLEPLQAKQLRQSDAEPLLVNGGLRTKGYQKLSWGINQLSPQPEKPGINDFLPLVTIITVVYNNELYLEETINSVINQSYDNLEYIIVDGGSTDRTLEIIRQYDHYLDYWISESDRGLYDAMNKGIALAKGEIIGILNSDDLYLPNTVEQVVQKYQQQPQPCVIYGSMYKFADQYQSLSLHQGDLSDRAFRDARVLINHPTCFVQRTLYENWGRFKPEYEVGADRELMMRFHSHQATFVNLKQPLAKFRLGGTTSNQSLGKIFRRELIQEYKLLTSYQIPKRRIAAVLGKKTVQGLRKWIFYLVLGEKLTNQLIMSYVSRKFPQHQPD